MIITLPFLNRILVLDPEGNDSVLLDDGEGATVPHPTNCAFGGPDYDRVYVGSIHSDRVATFPLGRRGHPPYNLR
jgi:sugar lactone lactonase YvrE